MTGARTATGHDGGQPCSLARLLAEICEALEGAGLAAEEAGRPAAHVVAGRLTLEARLAQIQRSLDRIETRLAEVEQELAVLIRPGWPF